jgi:hypothetical protein
MGYREPGVYTQLINARPNLGFLPNLVPLIIGEGPAYFDHEEVPIVRGSSGDADTLPATKVTDIARVYTLVNGVETTIPDVQYTLTSPNIITWNVDAAAKPSPGSTYYVDLEARPEATQYAVTFVTSFSELSAYGGQLMKTASGGDATTVNPVYMGAYLALESGAPGVYIIQVEPADKDTYEVVMATDIINSLALAETIEDAYYVVPMTDNSEATMAVTNHCNVMSTTEERKERVCIISLGIANPAASTGIFSSAEILSAVSEVESVLNKRVLTPFISSATKTLSDGVLHSLPAEYVCAAIAGLKALLPPQRALTRQRLYNFVDYKYVTNLTRVVKNRLAEAGFTIIDQPGGTGSAGIIRHGITTKVDNVADREFSVVVSADFVAKFLRDTLEGYIGIYNINEFLKTKVKASITSARNVLIKNDIINDLILGNILQDQDNPDTLLVDVSFLPQYPCNYIDLKILVE